MKNNLKQLIEDKTRLTIVLVLIIGISIVPVLASYYPGGGSTIINSTDGVIPYRSNSTTFTDSPLIREDANTTSQRNGVNSQLHYIYNTFTSSTNYERLAIGWDSGNSKFILSAEKGSGGGSGQSLFINAGFPQNVQIGSAGTVYWEFLFGGNLSPAQSGNFSIGRDSATIKEIVIDKTVTTTGTTGAQTIDKNNGTVNFAAVATSLVVTNARVTVNSIIQCTVATNDATMKSAQCVAGSGSFTIFPNAVPTGETRVNFSVFN